MAEALGYGNPQKAIRDHVAFEDKGVNEMVTPGGTQKAIFVNESCLYALTYLEGFVVSLFLHLYATITLYLSTPHS